MVDGALEFEIDPEPAAAEAAAIADAVRQALEDEGSSARPAAASRWRGQAAAEAVAALPARR